MAETIVLAFPERIVPVRNVRSTVLLGSIEAVRAAGHFDRYVHALEPRERDVLLQTVAGVWLPIDAAHAHYRACDALALAPDAQARLGHGTFERVQGTLLGTGVRLARNAGVTPWTVFPYFQRFWSRGYDGGGIRITQLGPKEVTIEVVNCGILGSTYYKNGLRGLVAGMIGLFCSKAYVHELPRPRSDTSITYRAQWA